jgi:uncharacterized protein
MTGRHPTAGHRDGRFDAFELAARRGSLDGSVEASALPAVAEALAEGAAPIAYRIVGTTDGLGRPALAVELDGAVPVRCQRCLQAFGWPVAQRTLLLIARDERELARLDEDDEHEVVLAAEPLDALALVEEELLLTLPYAPRHPPGTAACDAGVPIKAPGSAPVASRSPFGALAALKPGAAGKRKG